VDCSLCTFLAVCDRCVWRSGPYSTQPAADRAVAGHLAAEHPAAARKQRERTAA